VVGRAVLSGTRGEFEASFVIMAFAKYKEHAAALASPCPITVLECIAGRKR
jgi:hypothetical protein